MDRIVNFTVNNVNYVGRIRLFVRKDLPIDVYNYAAFPNEEDLIEDNEDGTFLVFLTEPVTIRDCFEWRIVLGEKGSFRMLFLPLRGMGSKDDILRHYGDEFQIVELDERLVTQYEEELQQLKAVRSNLILPSANKIVTPRLKKRK